MRNQWRHARLGSAAPQKKKKTSALLTTAAAAAARSTVGFIAGRIVEVSHRPEIKQAIIHILFGEGKIKVNPSFCSSWSSFGLGSVFSTWSRLRWLAGFWGSFFCLFFFFALMVYLHLTSETSLRWKPRLDFIITPPHVWCRLLPCVKCNADVVVAW